MSQKKGGLLRDAASTFGTNAFGAVLALIASFCVMPVLGPAESGLITQNQMVGSGLFTILSLSVNSSIIYYVSRYKLKNVIRAIKKVSIILALVIAAVGTIMVVLLRDSYFHDTITLYCACAVAYGVFSFISNIFLAILRGENQFKTFNAINLFQRVMVMLFSLTVFIWRTAGVIIVGSIFTLIAASVFAMLTIRKSISYANTDLPAEDDVEVQTSTLVKFSIKAHVSNVLTYINGNGSSILLKGFSNLTDFGIFTKASTIIQQVWILPDAVSMVIMTRLAAMKEKGDKTKLAVLSCKMVVMINLVCLVLVYFAARVFIPIVFPKYIGCIEPLGLLTVGSFFITYAKMLGNSIAAYGRPELNILPTVVGVVLNLGLSLLLIPQLYVMGAALATTIALSAQGIACALIFCRFTKTPLLQMLFLSREEMALIRQTLHRGRHA